MAILKLMRHPTILVVLLSIVALTLTRLHGGSGSALEPLCNIPGLSTSIACAWITAAQAEQPPKVQWADYHSLVGLETRTFEEMLNEPVRGTGGSLSLDVKKTEYAVRDLIALVKASELKAKDSLAELLRDLIDDAATSGRGLNRLSTKFNGALDVIVSVNEHALHSVAKAQALEQAPLLERINAMMPWSPPRKDVDAIIKETFSAAMDAFSVQLAGLLVEATARENELRRLEETLQAVHEHVQREYSSIDMDKEETLELLWTKLGGNGAQLRSFSRNLKLLEQLKAYRKGAYVRIIAALHHLESLRHEADDIRTRVSAPDLMGSMIEPAVHMKSLQSGLVRLKANRLRARKLEEAAIRDMLRQ
ncbi:hypothetical protein CC1G_10949 [Coprinopsis cinerea okayama7|uniref:Uncharacterized protein n=1 Tax=Coprinopsis cinerea (strain Okayama-7 / 130 / ATCC MYA-4618 / FGSC 9003) TaxID=240176 RepID=A8NT63_COPC7|nr:hypothetical protein CC1G_10949 [Coprinopsis cinerea okayama7\|eukprot:XP_001836168.1 hypothetical protein CC1G_10949 [Coprinopsis cinerea okayama7\